jgi:tetratricopeptide (TPR) repeat protein
LAWIVYELGNAALRTEDYSRALAFARESVDRHTTARWNEGLAAALAATGRALLGLNRPDEALATHGRSLRIGLELPQPYVVADALEGMADALARTDRAEQAVEALGCAAALRERSGVRAYAEAPRKEEVAAVRAAVRHRLGSRSFDEAFALGEQLSPSALLARLDL